MILFYQTHANCFKRGPFAHRHVAGMVSTVWFLFSLPCNRSGNHVYPSLTWNQRNGDIPGQRREAMTLPMPSTPGSLSSCLCDRRSGEVPRRLRSLLTLATFSSVLIEQTAGQRQSKQKPVPGAALDFARQECTHCDSAKERQ